MNPFQSLIGTMMARNNANSVNNGIVSRLNDRIGPTGIQGEKNYDNNYSQMSRYMNQGDPQSAIEYARTQQQKVGANTQPIYRPQVSMQGQMQAMKQNIQH